MYKVASLFQSFTVNSKKNENTNESNGFRIDFSFVRREWSNVGLPKDYFIIASS